MSDALGFRLLAITPPVGAVDAAVVQAWSPGRAVGLAVLLREPGTAPRALVDDAHRLAPLRRACARAGIGCLVSVDPTALDELAKVVSAEGVMGIQVRGDPSAEVLVRARARLPGHSVLGRSCHGHPDGMGERVDYSVLAPIFTPQTPSPPSGWGKRAVGLSPLRSLCARERRVFALGGITPTTAPGCVEAGAYGLAAIRSFFGPLPAVEDNVAHLAGALAGPADHAAPP